MVPAGAVIGKSLDRPDLRYQPRLNSFSQLTLKMRSSRGVVVDISQV
jgi:hypothetical protein